MFETGLVLLSWTLLTVVVAPDPSSGAVTIDDCVQGEYFNDHMTAECKACGECRDEAVCEKSTGLCPNGCQMWFYPPDFCWGYVYLHDDGLTLAHITDGPEVKDERSDRVEICFYQNQTLVGLESAQYYVYIIEYAEAESNEYKNDVDYIPVQSTLLIHKDVIGLDFNTEYKFRVVLFRVYEQTVYERVDTSAVSYGKTACMAPERAMITSAAPLPALTTVRVNWHLGSSGCDNYKRIELIYQASNGSEVSMLVQESMPETIIYNLFAGLAYIIYIRARNNADLYTIRSDFQVNLIPEEVKDDPTNERQNQEDDDTNDRNFYIAIAVGATGALLAVIAIIMVISVYCKLKNSHNLTPRKAPPSAISAANPSYEHGNGTPALPAARGPSVASHKYEGLGARPEGQTYDSLNEGAYEKPYDNSPDTYDVL